MSKQTPFHLRNVSFPNKTLKETTYVVMIFEAVFNIPKAVKQPRNKCPYSHNLLIARKLDSAVQQQSPRKIPQSANKSFSKNALTTKLAESGKKRPALRISQTLRQCLQKGIIFSNTHPRNTFSSAT